MAKKSINKVILTGNLGKDPLIKRTPDGTVIATTSIAVTGWNDEVSWANLVAFKGTAELFEEYLHKGDAIGVVGRYQVRTYQHEGETRYSHEIVVEDVTFLGGKKNGSTESSAPEDTDTPRPASSKRPTPAIEDEGYSPSRQPTSKKRVADDDIPF